MDAFKAIATMSLVDLISGPLGRIDESMNRLGAQMNGLSGRMGRLALAMAPVALVAGTLLMAFGALAKEAIAFESVMADVAKVVDFETKAELQAMSDTILEMSGRIPMAADGIGAIISAAAQSGIAKNDLTEFAEAAAKMGVAFDLTGDQAGTMMADWRAGMNLSLPRVYALADAVNHLSNNMNATAPALGDVIQRVGPMAMAAGLAEQQVAALGAAFLSAGAAPEIAATALKKFTSTLVMGAAMTDQQAEAFKRLGFNAVQMAKDMQADAQGTIMKVLQSLADKPKELQISLLYQMFGEQGVGAIAPLLANMGNLSQAFDLVADSTQYAGSMQGEFDARAATTENALILLKNKFSALSITMGNAFLPAIKTGAEFMGDVVEGIRRVMSSPLAQWLLQAIAALAGGVVAIMAFAGAVWLLGAAGPAIGNALAPLKAILLSVSWPVYAMIAAFAAFYLAYKTNFGGFADFVNGIFKKVSLVFQGVRAVVTSMVDGVGEIRGELGQEIQAAGLLGVVTNISRLFYRATRLFKGFQAGLSTRFDSVSAIFGKSMDRITSALGKLGQLFAPILDLLSSGEAGGAASTWETFGNAVGVVAGWLLEKLAAALLLVANYISIMIDWVRLLVAVFTGDWTGAGEIFSSILDTMADSILSIADLFGFGDWLRESWAEAMEFLAGFDLFETGSRILTSLWNGIKSVFQSILNWFSELWSGITGFFSGNSLENEGAGLVSDLLNGALSLMGGIVDLGMSLVNSFLNGITSVIGGVFSAGSSLANGLIEGVSSLAGNVLGLGVSIVDDLIGGITGMAGGLLDAGASVASGFVNGLNSVGSSISGWCSGVWDTITGFFTGESLAGSGKAIMETLGEGVTSAKDSVVNAVSGVFSKVRNLLPFSDAKEGPLSELTASGAAIMGTLGTGVASGQHGLVSAVSGVFSTVDGLFDKATAGLFKDSMTGPDIALGQPVMPEFMPGEANSGLSLPGGLMSAASGSGVFSTLGELFNKTLDGVLEAIIGPDITLGQISIPETQVPEAPGGGFAKGESASRNSGQNGNGVVSIHIEHLELPNVADTDGFIAALQGMVAEYDGVSS